MLINLIQNFWLGFVITATPGAVLLEAMRRSLNPGLHLLRFLAGNFVGMLVVITLSFAGVSVLQNSVTGSMFFIISGSILLFIGLSTFLAKPQLLKSQAIVNGSEASSLFAGLILAVANPLSFVFWLSIIGGFRDGKTITDTVLSISAVVAGALSVFVLLILAAQKLQTIITPRREQFLSRLFGALIILFALVILYKAAN